MQKILLYYMFTPLADPAAVCLWQKTLCQAGNLKGRIILSPHGINGTVGGELRDLKQYVATTKQYPAFKDIDFKWSDGQRDDFPKLSVKVRDEIVSFEAGDELQVGTEGVVNGGRHLKPAALHKLMAERDDVVMFDGRNAHEASIGKFKDAVVPAAETSKDFIKLLDSGQFDDLKSKPVVTYCTGGIRCEILSSLMKQRGFEDVYQLDGGIVRYGEEYGDDGLWEGSLYIFDGRQKMEFSDHSRPIGSCLYCENRTSRYINCAVKSCNRLALVCDDCSANVRCLDCQLAPSAA